MSNDFYDRFDAVIGPFSIDIRKALAYYAHKYDYEVDSLTDQQKQAALFEMIIDTLEARLIASEEDES